jgi:hypothetical protein
VLQFPHNFKRLPWIERKIMISRDQQIPAKWVNFSIAGCLLNLIKFTSRSGRATSPALHMQKIWYTVVTITTLTNLPHLIWSYTVWGSCNTNQVRLSLSKNTSAPYSNIKQFHAPINPASIVRNVAKEIREISINMGHIQVMKTEQNLRVWAA